MHRELFERKEYLVPFIGDDLYYVETPGNGRQSLQSYIVESFVRDNPHVVLSTSEIDKMKNSGYYGLTLLNRKFKDRYISHYKEYVKSAFNVIKLNPIVKRFLELGNFPLIITTSPFSILEKELSVSYCSSLYYSVDNPPVNETIDSSKHTVFHLFGHAERFKSKWVYNERELLMFLHSLHDSATAPKGVTSYLADKSMLIMGCNLPNWLFQFLWFPMNIQRSPMFPTGEDSTEGYWLGKAEDGSYLDDFLQEIGFASIEEMESVVLKVIDLFENEVRQPDNDLFDVFISYASENANVARQIKNHLVIRGLRVWIDKDGGKGEIEIGGEYWKRIKNGIRKSRYFMPIVTGDYLIKWLLNSNGLSGAKEPGLVTETKMAVEWLKSEDNPFKDEDVYSLPVIVENGTRPELLEDLVQKEILPKDIFGGMQCYTYSANNNCTFNSHHWENYRR